MNDDTTKLRALVLSVLLVLSVVVGTVSFSGTVAAATNTSITVDDDDAGASDVTYTADGNVELANQKTLQHVDVHLSPADVSNVGESDVDIFIDGNEYTDGFSQFSTSAGTVEFKLANSRSLSDGDPVRVVVADVTNPSDDFDASATFHDTADDQFQSYQDTVAIDTPPSIQYSNLAFDASQTGANDTTINVGEDLTVSATVENTGEQTGTYNASLNVDGDVAQWENGTIAGGSSKTVSFVTSYDSTGAHDITIKNLESSEVTVTGPLSVADGSADPSTVDPGTTVSNQMVYVDVANVSQDGDTDWHYVEFPDALADSISVNSANSNATSITSSANLVDGYDNDGEVETVKFATSGDGGGDIDLNLSVDAGITYPDSTATYGVDARTVDSDGEVSSQADVVTIDVGSGSDNTDDSTDDNTDDSTDDNTDDSTDDNTDDSTDDGSGDGDGGGLPIPPTPSVTEFYLTADGQDVDVVVKTDHQTDELQVDVSGAANTDLSRSEFTAVEENGTYVHTADVSTDVSGVFDARIDALANGFSDGTAGQTDTLTVELPASVGPSAVASPTWTGVSDSTHTFRLPIGANTSVTNETLAAVAVRYSDQFLNRSGSISSVSDDQNVETLLVQDANGTVRSRMGGTDAVSVNVEGDAVHLDLSDVDSSRKPTLEAGDRVVVRLRPVTNAGEAATYRTETTLETQAGNSTTLSAPLGILNEDGTGAIDTGYTSPSEGPIGLVLNGSDAVDLVTVDSRASASGAVRVTVPADSQAAVDALSRPVVTTLTVSRPDAAEDDPATITTQVETDAFQSSASALTLARYDDSAGNWTLLTTSVVDSSDETVTVQATAQGTSTFALLSTTPDQEEDEQQESTPQPDPEDDQQTALPGDDGTDQRQTTPEDDSAATQQPTSQPGTEQQATETTDGAGLGFGLAVAALAVLGAALLVLRRRR